MPFKLLPPVSEPQPRRSVSFPMAVSFFQVWVFQGVAQEHNPGERLTFSGSWMFLGMAQQHDPRKRPTFFGSWTFQGMAQGHDPRERSTFSDRGLSKGWPRTLQGMAQGRVPRERVIFSGPVRSKGWTKGTILVKNIISTIFDHIRVFINEKS